MNGIHEVAGSIPAWSTILRYYTGVTSHTWAARLAAHNAGRCGHTARATRWELVVVVEFAEERRRASPLPNDISDAGL